MSRRLPPGRWVPSVGRRRARTTGLVLSGGGSRADFHLGALRYLYDEVGIEPKVMAGASAGAIVAAILSQGRTRDEQRAWLDHLDTLWRSMDSPDAMFRPLPWWKALSERGPGYLQLLDPVNRGSTQRTSTPPGTVPETAAEARAARATQGEEPERGWSAAQIVQMIGNLPALGRAGGDLAAILRSASEARSMYTPGLVVDSLIDTETFDPARVRASGVVLRIAMVGLQSGELRFADQDGVIRDRGDVPLLGDDGEPVTAADLALAVWASCAIPAVFEPIPIAGEHYIDGGVRENLPADVVIDKLGVPDVWAIVCHPPGADAGDSPVGTDIVSVMMRTGTSIMSDEQLRDEVVFARRAGARVVHATVDVHDTMTVDRGLTALMADHGWIRAAQTHLGASEADEDAGSALIRARRRAWEIEELMLAPDGSGSVQPPDGASGLASLARPSSAGARAPTATPATRTPEAGRTSAARTPEAGRPPAHRTDLRTELRRLLHREPAGDSRTGLVEELTAVKTEIRALLEILPAGHVPAHADSWWRTWETHGEQIEAPPLWRLDDDDAGTSGAPPSGGA
ncbi:patatin-like phospholipase family protein [Georgenia sp. Z1344]|uniref:patatin-like phospholipase family protein n=1 Tax=Georgenia sp. Z1344 TaxID=3416706 RepID=UPI003CF1F12F